MSRGVSAPMISHRGCSRTDVLALLESQSEAGRVRPDEGSSWRVAARRMTRSMTRWVQLRAARAKYAPMTEQIMNGSLRIANARMQSRIIAVEAAADQWWNEQIVSANSVFSRGASARK